MSDTKTMGKKVLGGIGNVFFFAGFGGIQIPPMSSGGDLGRVPSPPGLPLSGKAVKFMSKVLSRLLRLNFQ